MLALLLIHIAAVPPVHIARCGDVVIAENQIIEGEQVVLHADCGGRVEVRGTVRAQKQLRIVAAGIDVSGRLLAGQGDIFLEAAGPVVLRGTVEGRAVFEQGGSLAVSGFLAGALHARNADRAVTFNADTTLAGDVLDVDDIVVAPQVALTLPTAATFTFAADDDASGTGRIDMQAGSRIVTNGTNLIFKASEISTVGVVAGGGQIIFRASTAQGAQFNLTTDLTIAGEVRVEGATLNLGARHLTAASFELESGALVGGTGLLTVSGLLTISGGVFTAPSQGIELGGDFKHSGGRYLASGGTFTLNGSSTQVFRHGPERMGRVVKTGAGQVTYEAAWPNRAPIAIPQASVMAPGANEFPVPVRISGAHPLFAAAQATAGDLMFTDAYGAPLAYELEIWNPAGQEMLAWVRVPGVWAGRDTPLFVHYGNPASDRQERGTATWDDDFVLVMHLSDTPSSGRFRDSTRFGNHGAYGDLDAGQGVDAGVPARLGNGVFFEGYDRVPIASSASLNGLTALTVETWAYPTKLRTNGGCRMLSRNWTGPDAGGWAFYFWLTGALSFSGATPQTALDGGGRFGADFPNPMDAGVWFHTAATVTSTQVVSYLDGVASLVRPGPPGPYFYSEEPLYLSSNDDIDSWLGILDEVRLSRVARSGAWLATSAALQRSPPGVGPQQSSVFDKSLGEVCLPSDICRVGTCSNGFCCLETCSGCSQCGASGFCEPCTACDAGMCVSPDGGPGTGGGSGSGGGGIGGSVGGGAGGGTASDGGPGDPKKYQVVCGCDHGGLAGWALVGWLWYRRRRAQVSDGRRG